MTLAVSPQQRLLATQAAIAATIEGAVHPRWIGNKDCFWFERHLADDIAYVLANPEERSATILFHRSDVQKSFKALGYEPVPGMYWLDIAADQASASFEAFEHRWSFDIASGALRTIGSSPGARRLLSPDGTRAVYVIGGDVFVAQADGGNPRQLTFDGSQNPYADYPAPMRDLLPNRAPQALWSPCGKTLFTLQTQDDTLEPLHWLEYVPDGRRRPRLQSVPTPLPGDVPATLRLLLIDVESGSQRDVKATIIPSRMYDTPFAAGSAWWSASGERAYVLAAAQGERAVSLLEIDARSGSVRTVFTDEASSPIELGPSLYGPVCCRPLPGTSTMIWFSESDGYGHLYLRDMQDGTILRQLTKGPFSIQDIVRVDYARGAAYIVARGRDQSRPYRHSLCCLDLESGELLDLPGSGLEEITWSPDDHRLSALVAREIDTALISAVSPSGRFVVRTVGEIDQLPITEVVGWDGDRRLTLGSVEAQLPPWWRWPRRVTSRSHDGTEDLHGILFEPMVEFAGTAPLIDVVYGGPQLSVVPGTAFGGDDILGSYAMAAGFAAMGAYALLIDGRGVTGRSRAFREHACGALQDCSDLDDHIAAIKSLAEHDNHIDLDRVGVMGFSGGGYLAAHAALRHGDFYKVAVASSGNYDQAVFWQTWGERYQGPYTERDYRLQAARHYAEGLTGKLLLMHGLMDRGVHPVGLFQLLQALIDADKDPDLILLPRGEHEITPYGWRRIADYFAAHLFGARGVG